MEEAGRREELRGGSKERVEQHVPLAPLAPLSPLALFFPNSSECTADVFILLMHEALLDSSGPSALSSLLPATPQSLYLRAVMSPLLCFFFRQDVVPYCSSNQFHISPSEQDSSTEQTGSHADSLAACAALLMQQVRASLKGKFAHFRLVAYGSVEVIHTTVLGFHRGEGFLQVSALWSVVALCLR